MEEDDELLPGISSSPLFGEAHREHLLYLHTKNSSHAGRRSVVAVFGAVYFCIGASSFVLAPFFPLDVSRIRKSVHKKFLIQFKL